ncbi:LysR family transcriptional regulator [Massilia putida]|uniref:LysR family transcriptional regulator n=1 Tax=Massilia putida TaxID=1141883 RepID=UPI001C54E3EA|nr:LysR family transcriptional regulator [Massilia putida]
MNELEAFVAVGTLLSFQKAAVERGVTRSALSHSIKTLEQHLGVRLLNRNTRGVTLTEPGKELLQRIKPAFAQVADALEGLNDYRGSPTGSLKLTTPRAVAHAMLGPAISQLINENPGLSVDVWCDDRLIDIVAEGFDAGIRFGRSLQPDMVALPLKRSFEFKVVGSPTYLEGRHVPNTPAELLDHNCIRYRLPSGIVFPWEFSRAGETVSVEVAGRLTLDDQGMMVECALSGAGLALVFADLVQDHVQRSELIECISDWTCSIGDLYLYYSSRRHVSAALRELINVLTK